MIVMSWRLVSGIGTKDSDSVMSCFDVYDVLLVVGYPVPGAGFSGSYVRTYYELLVHGTRT